jgi:hypothetical protein
MTLFVLTLVLDARSPLDLCWRPLLVVTSISDLWWWKDGQFIHLSSILEKNSNVSVKMNFVESEYYCESKITSYKANVFNCKFKTNIKLFFI